ncbi:uncharacterized protein LOC119830868 [Zerene cesonia]|uniref:uncharacterized protein LOC119830868 n=1 Tax=Zerene cesonia TaxID=33412 RepID=UPI0018E5482A|nr:uncharacterized protein LOC119830868 [Zerene cesonia]
MPLPESLSSIITDAKKFTNIDIHTKVKEINQSIEIEPYKEEITLVRDEPETPEFNCDLKELNDDIKYSPYTEIDIDDDENNLNLSEAILNPKMLLESLQNETEVIPPPPEFCDDIAYSRTNDNNTNYSDMEFNFMNSTDEENLNIFATENYEHDQADEVMDIIPPKEVESWNLSTEEDTDSVPFKPYQYSNNSPWGVLRQNSSQRHEKLNRFKFTRNSDLKLKKRV